MLLIFPARSWSHQWTRTLQIAIDSTTESTTLYHSLYMKVGYSLPILPMDQSASKSLLIPPLNQQRFTDLTIGINYSLPIPPLDQSLYIMMHDTCNYTSNKIINTTYMIIINYNSPLYNLYMHDNHNIHP